VAVDLSTKVTKGSKFAAVYQTDAVPDFSNVETFRQGHPSAMYNRLHAEAPVFWHDEPYDWGSGYWAVTKYDDVVAISKNPELFSSERGGHQIHYGDPATVDVNVVAAITGNMIAMDPPLHQTYRRMVSGAFTPKALGTLEATMRARIDGVLDDISGENEIDFPSRVAALLPIYTLADLLGVPDADRPKLLKWTDMFVEAADPAFCAKMGMSSEAISGMVGMEMFAYGQWLFQEKKKCPAHDLMSVVANAKPEGGDIPQMHLDGFFLLMVVAGNETTRNTISGMMHLLSKNPDQKQKILDNPALLSGAVDEALRLVSPVIHFRRTATRDTELSGQKIAAGDKVVMWYGAANRDADIFPDPLSFDVTRSNASRHVSFGIGEHFCLGSVLGKQQIERMYERLFARFPNMQTLEEPHYVGSNFISGIKHLKVKTV
jgi:cytochrome P450